MNLLGKGQASRVGKGDLGGQVPFLARLFAVAASVQQEGGNLLAFGSCAFLQHNQLVVFFIPGSSASTL
jgi:hypothetical protein